jgi:FlaA1/EpsC-like NDP-sugar epimerase
VIGISTDKASPPVRNTYGLSKALMERVLFDERQDGDEIHLCALRQRRVVNRLRAADLEKDARRYGRHRHDRPGDAPLFFTVDEAVKLVTTAMNNIENLQGKVLARRMKAAQVRDILELWVNTKGGKWEKIEGRPGERIDEFLIGDLELPHTSDKTFDDVQHYIISFNQTAAEPVEVGLSSANAERLTEAEILDIINHPPLEEV